MRHGGGCHMAEGMDSSLSEYKKKQRRDPSPGFIAGVDSSTVKHSIWLDKPSTLDKPFGRSIT